MIEKVDFKHCIKTEEELREIVGFPSELVKNKVITYLDHHCVDFISKSPFLVISTLINLAIVMFHQEEINLILFTC